MALDQNCESYSHRALGSFSEAVASHVSSLREALAEVYGRIQDAAPNADVYVLSYPMFIPSETNGSCGGVFGLDGEERTWLRLTTMLANNTIESAAADAGVTFVDVEQILEDVGSPDRAGHLICADEPWHHGASIDEVNPFGVRVKTGDNPSHNRFHPKRESHVAQAQFLAECLRNMNMCNPPTPWLYCNGHEATIYGTNGDDKIGMLVGGNVVVTLGGDDEVVAEFGHDDDVICGGDGDDKLSGGDGDDFISGDRGNDVIYGDDGNDTLRGGDDDDILHGKNGDDRIFGENGADVLHGGRSNHDYCDGGLGEDTAPGSWWRTTCETMVSIP